MNTKITFEVKGDKSKIKFTPAVDKETFVPLINNMLNNIPNVLASLLVEVPLLRPACDKEQDAHIYVFQEGPEGDTENKLYKYRKYLYDTISSVFSVALTTAFPDIEYIEACKRYQQDYCMDHTEQEVEEYKKVVTEITEYVRTHFKEILRESLGESDVQENLS